MRCLHRDQQVVVLAHVLACEITIGYEEITNNRLIKFNGTEVNVAVFLWEVSKVDLVC